MQYDVWSIPTPKAVRAFGWVARKLNDTPLDKENADELRYLSSVDARTPDQDAYVRYVLRPVALTIEQIRELEATPIDAYISPERLAELEQLIKSGYALSALIAAIRETVYAVNTQIVIPATSRE